MQFTPQQMAGYKGYSNGVLIGNWSEDVAVQEDKLRGFQQLGHGATVNQLTAKCPLQPPHSDGLLRYNQVVRVESVAGQGACLALDASAKVRPKLNHAAVSLTGSTPMARCVWVLKKVKGPNSAFYTKRGEGDIIHFGEQVRIVNDCCSGDGFYSLHTETFNATLQSRGGKQLVSAALGGHAGCKFTVERAPTDGKDAAAFEGQPVPLDATVVLRSATTNVPLYADVKSKLVTVGGAEVEVAAHLDKAQSTRMNMPVLPSNHWTFGCGAPGAKFSKFLGPLDGRTALERVKSKILDRGGRQGFRGLVKTLRIMDDDGSKTLDRREFKEGLEVYGVFLTTAEMDVSFDTFDSNGDGVISITEFLRALRGDMNHRRTQLVKEAFKRIDHDGSGVASFEEMRQSYGANLKRHPAVVRGAQTEDEVLVDFMSGWDKNGDASVTEKEFIEYYADVSVNIDNEDYFELMIRNAWHMSGGEGAAANTSCRRVLVVYEDDRQEVVELTDDLGIDGSDMAAIRAKLKSQGVNSVKRVELYG